MKLSCSSTPRPIAGLPSTRRAVGWLARLTQLADAAGNHVETLEAACWTSAAAPGSWPGIWPPPGLRVTGCDISANMLNQAAADSAGAGAEWVPLQPGWQTLPFASASFQRGHRGQRPGVRRLLPAAVLGECARVLRPGGVMLCTVPDLGHPVRWAEWLAWLLTGMIPVRAAGAGKWHRYRVYLRSSRQRHRIRWWLAASARVGLRPVCCPGRAGQSPLRLLVFGRPGAPS